MAVGAFLSAVGIATLGKSFGISAAARKPVFHGIYKYLRHPVYLGELISYLGVMIFRFSWGALGVYLVFLVLQILRARIEEEKLEKIFPEYGDYRERTSFFPFVR